jgi:hypothetical protein
VFRVSGCLLKLCGDNELGGNRQPILVVAD